MSKFVDNVVASDDDEEDDDELELVVLLFAVLLLEQFEIDEEEMGDADEMENCRWDGIWGAFVALEGVPPLLLLFLRSTPNSRFSSSIIFVCIMIKFLANNSVAILLSLRTLGPWAYGMTERKSSRASFKSCILRRSRAFMLRRVAVAAAAAASVAADSDSSFKSR